MKKAGRPAKATSAHARLRLLQHRIYRALEREARYVFGKTPASIRRYEREYERDFHASAQIATKAELLSAIRAADVSFIADYHTFAQAQRTALRLMREAILPGERWALGVELIPSQFQEVLDAFQAGRIGVGKFHERIHYEEQWGFPWKNYEPLFAWAREHQVRLIALNRPHELVYRSFSSTHLEDCAQDLPARDQWAAGIMTDLFQQSDPNHPLKMLVLYGGLHVSRGHLPAELTRVSRAFLGRPLHSLTIHQNHDALYWKLARQERELHAQVLKLRRQTFCVFSATPWAQLQSRIGSAEGENLEECGEPEELDYLSLMSSYGGLISDFFGLGHSNFESLSLRTIEEADFVDSLGKLFSPAELRLVRALVGANDRVYLPRVQLAYLASPSPNAAAEFAAIHLLRQQTRLGAFYEGGREDFFRLILEAAFGFLGSLILNPRRKCDLQTDHSRRIRQLKQGERPTFPSELKARSLTLEVLRPKGRFREKMLRTLPLRITAEAAGTVVATRYLGQILATRVHPVLLAQKHGAPDFKKIVRLFLCKQQFEVAYLELCRLTPLRKRVGALSKTESL